MPLHTVLDLAVSNVQWVSGWPPVIIIGRSRWLDTESHQAELHQIIGEWGLGSSLDSVLLTSVAEVWFSQVLPQNLRTPN